jgi:hypothetical protein
MESFARFWRARDRLHWTVRPATDHRNMEVDVTADEAIEGLTFEFQGEMADLQGDAQMLSDRRRILLPALPAGGQIHIQVRFHVAQ